MTEHFENAFTYVIGDEGSKYTNDPHDSGGPTKFGVTLVSYASFIGYPATSDVIENLTLEQAKEFYRARYWAPLKCDQIQRSSFCVLLFDSAVLYGVGTTAILAQKALSLCGASLKFDGHIGDKSVIALNAVGEGEFFKAFHNLLLSRISAVVKLDPKNERYEDGWINRADRLLDIIKT